MTQPPYHQQPGHYYPPPGHYPPPPPRGTNGLAIAALVCLFVFAPASIALGAIARGQIRRTGEDGWGMATASMIIGIVLTALGVIAVVLWFVLIVALYREVGQLPTPN